MGVVCAALTLLTTPGPHHLAAQPLPYLPNPGPPSPAAQRQIMESLYYQLRWLDNATRNSMMYNVGADANLYRQFDAVRVAYETLKRVLLPWQLDAAGNDLAELDAGLGIISEAFPNFQQDLNNGRNQQIAYRTLCQVLRDSMALWRRQLDQVSNGLRLGR
jgi:hypothetical protein